MNVAFDEHLRTQLAQLEQDGLFKRERILSSRQGPWVEADGRRVVNLCANNYLGLAGRDELVEAAQQAARRRKPRRRGSRGSSGDSLMVSSGAG